MPRRGGRNKKNNGNGNGGRKEVIVVQARSMGQNPASSGRAARRRRRRARNRARGSSLPVMAGGRRIFTAGSNAMSMYGGAAPVSLAGPLYGPNPIFQSIEGGIVVAHSQKVFDFTAKGPSLQQVYRFHMKPNSLGWVAGIAQHFQHFIIRELNYRYVGTCSTGSGTRVTMAPYYEPQAPTGLMDNVNGFKNFIMDLPGVREFAGWTEHLLKVAITQFTRSVFRNVGFSTYRPYPVSSASNDIESENPGQLLVNIYSGGVADGAPIGELWADYVVELRAATTRRSGSVQFLSVETTDTALNLHTGNFVGDLGIAKPISSNVIEMQQKGRFTLICVRDGTNPNENFAAWTITDQSNNTVTTDRVIDSLNAGAYTANDTLDDTGFDVASASQNIVIAMFDAELGDQITIPALSSGTITQTRIHIIAEHTLVSWES